MEITNDPVLNAIAQRETATEQEAFGTPELGRDDFLKLLIAQLENQDPMQPAKDTEFVAQLATFSSLEQLISANDNLQSLELGQANLINSQALNLIGKEALVEANGEFSVKQGAPASLVYALADPASSATMTIYGPDNVPVRSFALDTSASGRKTLEWNGLDSEGNQVPDGTYRYEINATDLNGEPMGVAVFRGLRIDGVSFSESGIELISGDQEIPFDMIVEIRADQPTG